MGNLDEDNNMMPLSEEQRLLVVEELKRVENINEDKYGDTTSTKKIKKNTTDSDINKLTGDLSRLRPFASTPSIKQGLNTFGKEYKNPKFFTKSNSAPPNLNSTSSRKRLRGIKR